MLALHSILHRFSQDHLGMKTLKSVMLITKANAPLNCPQAEKRKL